MKKSDLYREWARVLDMCEGTDILLIDCLKINGQTGLATNFCSDPSVYQFAIAILEGKPVFVGDEFYEGGGNKCIIKADMHLYANNHCIVQHVDNVDWRKFSWNPPKKTFMLAGFELPAPIRELPRESWNSLNILEINDNHVKNFFYFDTEHDRNKVLSAIIKLLEDVSK